LLHLDSSAGHADNVFADNRCVQTLARPVLNVTSIPPGFCFKNNQWLGAQPSVITSKTSKAADKRTAPVALRSIFCHSSGGFVYETAGVRLERAGRKKLDGGWNWELGRSSPTGSNPSFSQGFRRSRHCSPNTSRSPS